MDPMFGRHQIDKREPRKNKKDQHQAEPVLYAPTLRMPRPSSDTVEVDLGFQGNGEKFTILKVISEEELNKLASTHFGPPIATPDFVGQPYQGQQFRFYPDIAKGSPIWITLKQTQTRAKLTLIMRVSVTSSQAEIEAKASEAWNSPTVFRSKFPQILDPNEIYWMKPAEPQEDAPPEPNEFKCRKDGMPRRKPKHPRMHSVRLCSVRPLRRREISIPSMFSSRLPSQSLWFVERNSLGPG
jgi:hypothetical protein